MRASSERVLTNIINGSQTHCSGLDWTILTQQIVQRYATDLISMRDLLRVVESLSPNNHTSVQNWMAKIRESTHALLVPFLEYPSNDQLDIRDDKSALWQQTFSRCKYEHTRLLVPEEGVSLGPEEQMLKWAVEETLDGICSVIVTIGLAAERIWAKEFNKPPVPESGKWKAGKEVLREGSHWTAGVEELMAWLSWAGEWTRCEEVCAWDEVCYIPMWPLVNMFPGPHGRRGKPDGRHGGRDGKGPEDGERPPDDGYRGPPGRRPGRCPHAPGFPSFDETDLWRPKCVNADYIMLR